MLFAGILGIATGACSDAGNDVTGDGGTSGTGDQAAVGTTTSTSGGEATAGGVTSSGSVTVGSTTSGATGTTGDASGGSNGDTTTAGTTEGSGGAGTSGVSTTTDASGGAESTTGIGGDSSTGSSTTHGPDIDGTCTESQPTSSNASGSGPYDVVVETNSDNGINEGTIFRPADLGGGEAFPILVWGEGGCSQNGLSNASSMAEIASYGYFVVADGTPNGSGSRPMDSNDIVGMGDPLIAYIDWAIDENHKPCSAYYHALDTNKVASNGFSCGGLMSTGTSGDPRMTTWGSTSSGTFSVDMALYNAVHTPVLIISGGPSDVAYENGLRDYDNISALGIPIMYFSKDIGHGGDLFQGGGGDFTKLHLAWLNWQLKGDDGATGMGVLVGAGCSYCSDSTWDVRSANL
jgi:hypothetical protein